MADSSITNICANSNSKGCVKDLCRTDFAKKKKNPVQCHVSLTLHVGQSYAFQQVEGNIALQKIGMALEFDLTLISQKSEPKDKEVCKEVDFH
jgi:hypothetical protein